MYTLYICAVVILQCTYVLALTLHLSIPCIRHDHSINVMWLVFSFLKHGPCLCKLKMKGAITVEEVRWHAKITCACHVNDVIASASFHGIVGHIPLCSGMV